MVESIASTIGFHAGNLFVTGSNGQGQLGTSDPIMLTLVTVGSDIWGSGQVTVVSSGVDHTAVVAGVPCDEHWVVF